MADIELVELVIKIPKSDYRCIKEIPLSSMFAFDNWKLIAQAIANGTPLPKGHGRLLNERQVVMALIYHDFLKDNVKCGDITKILDMATIIEADKGDEE